MIIIIAGIDPEQYNKKLSFIQHLFDWNAGLKIFTKQAREKLQVCSLNYVLISRLLLFSSF